MTQLSIQRSTCTSLSSILALSLACVAPACDLDDKKIGETGGTESGDGDGDGDGDDGNGDGDGDDGPGACGLETVTVFDDLGEIPNTFEDTLETMIGEAVGDYAGGFLWKENEGGWMVSHEGSSSELNMRIRYDGGAVHLTEVALHGQFPGDQLGGFPCSNTIEIAAQLDFATADGLFAESVEIQLEARAVDSSGLSFRHDIDFDSHQGELALADFTFDDAEITRVEIRGSFGGAGSVGGLGVEVLNRGLGIAGYGDVASFVAGELTDTCEGCEPTEYCQGLTIFTDIGELYTCTPLPDVCADAPSCDCLELEACEDFSSCTEGDFFTVICN